MDTQQYQVALTYNCIGFTVKNDGMHLIVEGPVGYVDVWPTTGKWMCRGDAKQGFGLRELLLYITKGETLTTHQPPVMQTLTLSKDSIDWLRGVVQNPLWTSPENELECDSKARKEIWDAIQRVKA